MAEKKSKILIIEDETMLQNMYQLKFEKSGFEVIIAEDGEAGIDIAPKEKPKVILLDIMMPKLDGFAVLEALRKMPGFKKTPIILMSNLGQAEDVTKGTDLGATDYVVKSNNTPAQIVAKVEAVLHKK